MNFKVTKHDLETSLHNRKSIKDDPSLPISIFYNIDGREDIKIGASEALAYSRISNKKREFFIKVDTYNRPFNPFDNTPGSSARRIAKMMGRTTLRTYQCSEKAFRSYVKFLQTHDIKSYNMAERNLYGS